MKRTLNHRPSPAMVVACVALTVALGGTSYAAVNLPRHSVGTAQLIRNAVVSAKVKNRSLLALDFKKGQLPAGPPGAKGDKGETGAIGPPGINLWAAFAAGATFVRGSGVVGTPSHPSTGYYRVTFNRNITAAHGSRSRRRRSAFSTATATQTPVGSEPAQKRSKSRPGTRAARCRTRSGSRSSSSVSQVL